MRGVLLRKRKQIKTDIFNIKFKKEISFIVLPKDKVLILEPLNIKIALGHSKMSDMVKERIDYLCLDFIYNRVESKNIDNLIESVKAKGFGGKVWKKNY